MMPPRHVGEIVDLSQLRNGHQPNELPGVQQIPVGFMLQQNGAPMAVVAASAQSELGFCIPKAHPDGCVMLSDLDVERIATKVVEIFRSRRKREPKE